MEKTVVSQQRRKKRSDGIPASSYLSHSALADSNDVKHHNVSVEESKSGGVSAQMHFQGSSTPGVVDDQEMSLLFN